MALPPYTPSRIGFLRVLTYGCSTPFAIINYITIHTFRHYSKIVCAQPYHDCQFLSSSSSSFRRRRYSRCFCCSLFNSKCLMLLPINLIGAHVAVVPKGNSEKLIFNVKHTLHSVLLNVEYSRISLIILQEERGEKGGGKVRRV